MLIKSAVKFRTDEFEVLKTSGNVLSVNDISDIEDQRAQEIKILQDDIDKRYANDEVKPQLNKRFKTRPRSNYINKFRVVFKTSIPMYYPMLSFCEAETNSTRHNPILLDQDENGITIVFNRSLPYEVNLLIFTEG